MPEKIKRQNLKIILDFSIPYDNKEIMNKLICQKCGHKWYQRSEKEPQMCPKCKARTWKEEKK